MPKRKIICLASMVFATLVVFTWQTRSGDSMKVFFLDVGQGDSIYIRTPSGRDVLIDAGPSRVVLERLAQAMPFFDRRIDIVIATHPDADHIGGMPLILERFDVGLYVESGMESLNAIDDEINRMIAEREVEKSVATQGMLFDFGGAVLEIMYPRAGETFIDTNSSSISAQLRFGSTSVMLTGDLPVKGENILIAEYGDRLQSDVLKAGHHGSRTSSSESFVDAVSPDYAVISAGKKNRYGHPHKEVLEIFDRLGASVLRTGAGNIVFVSDGKKISPNR